MVPESGIVLNDGVDDFSIEGTLPGPLLKVPFCLRLTWSVSVVSSSQDEPTRSVSCLRPRTTVRRIPEYFHPYIFCLVLTLCPLLLLPSPSQRRKATPLVHESRHRRGLEGRLPLHIVLRWRLENHYCSSPDC